MSAGLSSLHTKIEALKIPYPTYAGVKVNKNDIEFAELGGVVDAKQSSITDDANAEEKILAYFSEGKRNNDNKIIGVDIQGTPFFKKLISPLWLKEDIVSFITKQTDKNWHLTAEDIARRVERHFRSDNIVKVKLKSNNEVEVSELVDLEDYQKTTSEEDFELAKKLASEFNGKKLVFINATPQGGGVALMRHALIRFYKLLGVDARWYVLIPRKEVFDITKTKFHNVLQAVSGPDVVLTDREKKLFNAWSKDNAHFFKPVLANADVVVIDDPQPCGLLPYVKRYNPKAKIIYRSHIQIVGSLASQKGTAQNNTWSFIWDKIKSMDCFVAHPMKEFIPDNVPAEKIVFMPATTDPLDGLNKPLSEKQMEYYLKIFDKLLLEQDQTTLDGERPYIIQIARFDPAKGIPDVIESYRLLVEMMKSERRVIPQLVIAGNSSIDDPDGGPILNLTMNMLLSEKYVHLAKDVKVVRLPHIDQLLNTLLRKSAVVLQLSTKEGFEIKVTEGLMKSKPLIAYRTGGIPLQIEENVNGFLVEPGNTGQVAKHMYDLLTDKGLYEKMSKAASDLANQDYLTVPNAMLWLYLAVTLLKEGKTAGHYEWVKTLAHEYDMRNEARKT